jgi:hypothetical protein
MYETTPEQRFVNLAHANLLTLFFSTRSKCQPVKLRDSNSDCYVVMAMKIMFPKFARNDTR